MRNRNRKIRMIAAAVLAAVLCAGLVQAQEAAEVPETEQIEETMQAAEAMQLPTDPAEPVPVQEPMQPEFVQPELVEPEPVQPETPAPEPALPSPETVQAEEQVQEEASVMESIVPVMDAEEPHSEEAEEPAPDAAPAEEPVQEAGREEIPAQEAVLPQEPEQKEETGTAEQPAADKTDEPEPETVSQESVPAQEPTEPETTTAASGQTPQTPETPEEPVWLDLMPVEFRISEGKQAEAWTACPVSLEIANITNHSLEKLEIRIASKDSGYLITPYETEEEALEGIAAYGICEEGEQKNTEKTIRISSLPAGAKIKADLILYAMQEIRITPEETQIQVSCTFSAGTVRYQNAGDQKLLQSKEDPQEPVTEEPASEEPSTQEPASEEPSTEEPVSEEPSTEEPSTEEPTSEEPSTEEPSSEEPSTEEPSTEEPTAKAAEEGTDPADDEIITVEVIDDGEEEETEDEYLADWGYYDDWVVYGDYSGTQINTATPYVLVQSYSHKRTIHTGDAFGMEINFLNTSQKVAMENVVIKVTPSDSLSLASGTNTLFVSGIEAGGTISQQINLLAASECKEATQQIDLSVTFEYIDHNERKTGEASESITIPITQKDRLEIRDPSYDEMQAGREGVISVSYVNKGYTSLYNMEASLELENADTVEKTVYAGNVESGKTGTLDFLVTPQMDGDYTGTVTLTYEDAAQNPVSVVVPLEFYSAAAYVEEEVFFEEEELDTMETTEAGFPLLPVAAAAGGAAVITAATILLVRRKKKGASPEADLPDDWFEDEAKK